MVEPFATSALSRFARIRAAEVEISEVTGRAIVRVRTHARDAGRAAAASGGLLPAEPLTATPGDPTGLWVGPEQWLVTSDREPVQALVERLEIELDGTLHALSVFSSALTGLHMRGSGVRELLTSSCGLDLDAAKFPAHRCARTRFAGIPLVIHCVVSQEFDLYVDRSVAAYLRSWLAATLEALDG